MGSRSRKLSEQEAKAAHLAKMNKVAECIIKPVPVWLPEVLSHWSFDVRSQNAIDRIWPTRATVWQFLTRNNKLARELQTALNSMSLGVAEFLTTQSKLQSEVYLQELATELSRFVGFTAEARKSPLLVGENGKVRRGADKPLLPNTKPAKYICAAIIAEMISFFSEKGYKPPSARKANIAAERYWTAWPGPKRGSGTDPVKRWDRYFNAANDRKLEPLRKKVGKTLTIHTIHGI